MTTAEEYGKRIGRSLDYAREHLDENPSLADLAGAAAFSPFHFHRIFAAHVGETPGEHIRRLRLEKAANSLRYRPSVPATRIALECGFAAPSAFSRDFRARFGVGPAAYRKGKQKASASPARKPSGSSGDSGARRGELPPMRLACCSHFGRYGPGIGSAWGALARWAGPRGLFGSGSRMYGISWDNPDVTDEGKLRYDACLEVSPETEGSGPVFTRDVPGYRCIVLPYRGPERGLSAAYGDLYYRILPESGLEPEDFPAVERYLAPPKGLFVRRFDLEIYLPVAD